MQKLALLLLAAVAIHAAGDGPTKFGKALTLKQSMAVRQVLAKPEPLVGKTVQVKGRITEVCQMAGCWMALADLETAGILRVKVKKGNVMAIKSVIACFR